MEPLIKIDFGIIPSGSHAGCYFEAISDSEILALVPALSGSLIDRAIYDKLHPLYEKLRLAEIAKRRDISEYYGNVGDHIEGLDVKILTSFWIKQTGVFVISFADDQGHSFSAFHNPSMKFKKGELCKISGLISSHKEYRGQKQTCWRHLKYAI